MPPLTYTPVFDSDCWKCGQSPCVGICRPQGVDDTELCGRHFFADNSMTDYELWNEPKDDTE